jgi:CO/xanthine dehydrogenase Mo-binding subunit
VDFEDLPIITDPEEAMLPEAVLLHPDQGSNIFQHKMIRKGDVDKAFNEADVIVEGIYQTPPQEHAFLNTESGIGYMDELGRVSMIVTGQWPHKDRTTIAHALGLADDQVRVIYPVIGGAFGGREDIGVQIVLGLAVLRLHQKGVDRPVKVVLTREESTYDHCKRHPFKIYTRWAAQKNGKVTGVEAKLIADGGAYLFTTPVISTVATINATGPYDIPNVRIDTYDVYTNAVPRGAMRGFGGPQGAFSAEMQMGKLSEVLGVDPVELRMRNIAREGTNMSTGEAFPPGVTMEPVLEKCAIEAGWEKRATGWERKSGYIHDLPGKPHLRRGMGIACSFKNMGFGTGYQESCAITVELHGKNEIENVVIKHTATEVGQGTYTVIQQMAAEAFSVPLEIVTVMNPDTAQSGDSGAVSASRMTFMIGNAIHEAAAVALALWKDEERPVILPYKYIAPKTTPFDPETGQCNPNISMSYTAEAVELDVDLETGQTQIVSVICANDIGKAINPIQVEGQLQGGLVQSFGYALMENFVEEGGYVRTPGFSTYLIPTVLDVPEKMDVHLLEFPDPRGPWGARGVGEMPVLPFTPAVAAAIHDAIGVWLDSFPYLPEKIWHCLQE